MLWRLICQFFDNILNKRDFFKIINLKRREKNKDLVRIQEKWPFLFLFIQTETFQHWTKSLAMPRIPRNFRCLSKKNWNVVLFLFTQKQKFQNCHVPSWKIYQMKLSWRFSDFWILRKFLNVVMYRRGFELYQTIIPFGSNWISLTAISGPIFWQSLMDSLKKQ